MTEFKPNNLTPHLKRIKPEFEVDEAGHINWREGLVDYDASKFYRGKTVTNEEYNELFIKQATQSNYVADSLKEFFKDHLDTAIHNKVAQDYHLLNSYIKIFTTEDWGKQQADGYWYITIPASEHGFLPEETSEAAQNMTITTEVYLLDNTGTFYSTTQATVDAQNTVKVYTDDNTIIGFVVIKLNDTAYTIIDSKIIASQIEGLASVALSGSYNDLIDLNTPNGPETRLKSIESKLTDISTGILKVPRSKNADNAKNVSESIGGVSLSNIFVEGTNKVKSAAQAEYAAGAEDKGTIDQRLVAKLSADSTTTFNTSTISSRGFNMDLGYLSMPSSRVFFVQYILSTGEKEFYKGMTLAFADKGYSPTGKEEVVCALYLPVLEVNPDGTVSKNSITGYIKKAYDGTTYYNFQHSWNTILGEGIDITLHLLIRSFGDLTTKVVDPIDTINQFGGGGIA